MNQLNKIDMRSATIKFEEGGKEKGYVISEDDGNIKVSLYIDGS